MSAWQTSFQVNYSNAELKEYLVNVYEHKIKTGIFDFDLPGINFKKIHAKEFLAFKGGNNVSSPFYAKIKHRTFESINFIDVKLRLSANHIWPLIFMLIIPMGLIYNWIFLGTINYYGLIFLTIFFFIGFILLFVYYRWILKSFKADLERLFLTLNKVIESNDVDE